MSKTERTREYVTEWKSRVKAGEASREKEQGNWDRYIGYYKNRMWATQDQKVRGDLATVNLVYPLVSILLETTYNQNPYIFIRPTRPEFVIAAEVLETLINHIWYDLYINKQVRRCIKNAALCAVAPVELGFSGQYESGVIKPNEMPYVRATFPKDFVTDSNCETFDDDQSLFRGFKRKVSYAQFKSMYPDAAKELKPKFQEKAKRDASQEPNEKLWPDGIAPWTRVEYWQIQDLLTDAFYFIHDDLEEFVDVVKNPYSVEGFLSEVLAFNEVPGELWPMSDIKPVEFQQKELNKMRTFMMRHWKKLHPIYLYLKGLLSEEDMSKIQNAEDIEFVGLENIDPATLRLLDMPQMSADFYQHHDQILSDFRNISPINEYYQGGMIPGTKTAYETRQIMEGTGVRLKGHARAVTEFVERIARKLIQILKDFYTMPIVVQIAGEKGKMYWREFSRWEIQAEVDVRVHLGSTMPIDEQTDRLMAPQFYQTMRQEPLIDQNKVVRKTLQMYGIKDPDSWRLDGGPDTMQPNDRGGGANMGSNTAQGRLRMLRGQ